MKLRRIAEGMGVGLLAVWGVWSAAPAVAKTPQPVITGLAASPSMLQASGGQSTISASVANATSCTISATPALVGGAGTVSCSGGAVSQVVTLAGNTSPKNGVKYEITLTATGSGGTREKKVDVEVLPVVAVSHEHGLRLLRPPQLRRGGLLG